MRIAFAAMFVAWGLCTAPAIAGWDEGGGGGSPEEQGDFEGNAEKKNGGVMSDSGTDKICSAVDGFNAANGTQLTGLVYNPATQMLTGQYNGANITPQKLVNVTSTTRGYVFDSTQGGATGQEVGVKGDTFPTGARGAAIIAEIALEGLLGGIDESCLSEDCADCLDARMSKYLACELDSLKDSGLKGLDNFIKSACRNADDDGACTACGPHAAAFPPPPICTACTS